MKRVLYLVFLVFSCSVLLHAQTGAGGIGTKVVELKGKVIDVTGEPLPGASVLIKGDGLRDRGTATDMDGNFSIKINRPTGEMTRTVTVTYLGMRKQTVKLNAQNVDKVLEIEMQPDATMLQEVEIVEDGYNKLPRKDMVGAFTTVKAEDIMMPAYNTVDQMLQGKIAGLQVVNTSARVGATPKIKLRGTSTFLGSTDPLWVVDGVIQSDPLKIDVSSALTSNMNELIGNQVAWLNPHDIETITVLKDASATAIYGSRASNGVIVITTKRGSKERTSVRYSVNLSIRQKPSYDLYDFMNSKERIQFSKEAYDAGVRYQTVPVAQIYTYEGLMNMFNNRQISEADFMTQMQKLETGNTDWFDLLTRTSVSQNHSLSISGGTQKVTYNASLGYSDTHGMEIGNDQDQFTSRLNVLAELNKRLTVSVNLSGSLRNSDGYGPGVNPYSYALNTSRSVPCYEDNGELAYYLSYYTYQHNHELGSYNTYGYNIFNEMANSYSKNKATTFNVAVNAEYKLTDWLTFDVQGSISQSSNDTEGYSGERTSRIETLYRGYPYGTEESGSAKYNAALLPHGGQLTTSNSTGTSYDFATKLRFSKTFKEIHRLNAIVGMDIRSTQYSSRGSSIWGYMPERGEAVTVPTYPTNFKPVGDDYTLNLGVLDELYNGGYSKSTSKNNYMSFYGTLAYSLMNRYVFNMNVRSDASNRFGQDVNKRFEPTWSFGFSWKVAEEPFIKDNLDWLRQMNLRATYGIQGYVIETISPELIASYPSNPIYPGYDEYYLNISSIPNPYLKWERTRQWNLGLDLALFGISMNVEYYGRRSNAILSQDVAQEYGMSKMRLNGGIITNHGIEYTINFTPYQTKDFAWTIGLNAGKNWNKSQTDDRVAKADELTHTDFLSGNSSRPLKKGYPVSAFWSYSFAGLSPVNGYPTFNYINPKDNSGTADVDPTTFLVYSGQSEPDFNGGFNTRIRWKDFDLGADFAICLGAKKRMNNPYSSFTGGKMPSPLSNLSKTLNDRWKQPGDEQHTYIPALYTSIDDYYNAYLPNGTISNVYEMWGMSDVMVANGDFLRCTQVSFSYHLPRKLCQRLGIAGVTLNGNVNNLFVIADKVWKGYDPELGNSIQPKVYSLGLNVSF